MRRCVHDFRVMAVQDCCFGSLLYMEWHRIDRRAQRMVLRGLAKANSSASPKEIWQLRDSFAQVISCGGEDSLLRCQVRGRIAGNLRQRSGKKR
jgi:hypothetical protein